MLWRLPWARDDRQRAQSDAALCHRLLPQVSRTFALSIAMLPPTLRDAVGHAYLLCRIVDSIEDDARLPLERRLALFDAFDAVVAGDTTDENSLERAASEAGLGETAAESELCARSGAVLRAYRALDRSQREAIRPRVLEMSRGMREYATRAARDGRLRIADVADLERYCYFVAGTVGELLTELFVLEVPGVDAQSREELRRLAVSFGLGLQLVNIVKDVAADMERGACFLPASLAEREGIVLEELLDPKRRAEAMRVVGAVCELAEEKLRDAQAYTLAWPERAQAVRLFCAVPLTLALASLRAVREGTTALVPDATPKIGRGDVFLIVRDAISAAGSDRDLAALFARHARPQFMTPGAPMQQPALERTRENEVRERTERALWRAREWLLARQSPEGYWKGELATNVTMDAEDLLLRQFLGVRTEEQTRKTAVWIRSQQREDGTWANAYGAPADLSTTVEAYVALRLAGDATDAPHMRRAAEYVREHGGVQATRVFTRIWLAIFGLWNWSELPVLPPELMLLPPSVPLNVYDFACWARQTVVALTVVMTYRPVRPIPGLSLEELAPARAAAPRPLSWRGRAFEGLDRVLRVYHRRPLSGLRERALREAERWILRRQEADGSWGGIQPPWVYSLMALSLRGYPMDHPAMRAGLEGLERFTIHEGDQRRLEACQSPVWDTAYVIQALADAGVQPSHDALVRGVDWLLSQEIRQKGDWAVRRPELAASGWAFEFANVNYPDVDDTAEVVLALRRVLHPNPQRVESAVARAVRWMIGMRSKNGAWGAFDADNVQALCRDIPFCDFGEVIDEPSADVTAHVIEALAKESLGDHPVARRGLDWLLESQEADGSWFGRWGVNYVYGTGASLMALVECGLGPSSPSVRRAVTWLESHQNRDGGWGEDVRSYDDPKWAGVGDSTASQTAWALLGLIAAGERGVAVERGIAWLVDTQKADGRWDEPQFTGTGFPGDFYINYHLYRQVFPMMALGRYAAAMDGKPVGILPLRDPSLVQLRARAAS
ncbi:MAG TPA: squalene--hopene cyclase [Polyangiaceae bacterium]|nr:squalene--hopene cyclase [Polyangiaceae bacterium]